MGKFTDGYDPDVGDEFRYGDVPVKPASVIKGEVSGNNSEQDIGDIPGAGADAKLLYAVIDTTSGATTGSGDVTVVDSGGTTIFTSGGGDTAGAEVVGPADGEEKISADETLTAKIADNSNADADAKVSVFYTTA